MNKEEAVKILERVAEQNHVSAETVRREIMIAMDQAMKDEEAGRQWANIPHDTPEDFLVYLDSLLSSETA